jgi:hypothetical protein
MGIHHRHRRRQFVGRLVMIDDDEIKPEGVRRRYFFGIGDAAIDSNDEPGAAFLKPFQPFDIRPYPSMRCGTW